MIFAWRARLKRCGGGLFVAIGLITCYNTAAQPESAGDSGGSLRAVWTDPDFDPKHSAVYYARVLEIPTPIWQAFDAQFYNVKMPKQVPLSHQERAYTSPIWYTPK